MQTREIDKRIRPAMSMRTASAWLGAVLIAGGVMVLLDRLLNTGWLTMMIPPVIGLSFVVTGFQTRKMRLVIPGSLALGLGLGFFFAFSPLFRLEIGQRIGATLFAFGLGWYAIVALGYFLFQRIAWWAVLTGTISVSTGLAFLNGPVDLLLFAFFIGAGLGLVFLVWGISEHLFGLIIPGCLLMSIGPGVFAAWRATSEPNSLARTGIMLVAFSLGWGLITVFSRVITHAFVWWPLIPGGILAMVGWGLYIGGNPDNALSFIGNTGSIGLIIFGVYLLLLRRGIHN